jgi:hypothetical protein
MITIPTTELIGCLTDVLPTISDEKSSLAGVKIAWDGESLHFTTYDVYAGATVVWTPGEGAEGEVDDDAESDDIHWGGGDAPWQVWIWLPQVKEILKLFKLPAKLWRFPVSLKCSPTGDRFTVEREDGPRIGRFLTVTSDSPMLAKVPDVRAIAMSANASREPVSLLRFSNGRIGAFGSVRPHGGMVLAASSEDNPVGVLIGLRFVGFFYPAGAKNVRPYSILRDGAGVVIS